MNPLLGCILSGLFGFFVGAVIVSIFHRSQLVEPATLPIEPCFPPKLVIIEGGYKTGTDYDRH